MQRDFSKLIDILEVVKVRDSIEPYDPEWQLADTRLRELLEKKYGDEKALCIKSNFIPAYVKPGFVPVKKVSEVASMDLVRDLARIAEFVPRAYCEYNPLYKQIIPYIVGVTPEGKVFTMERIKGDDRLIGKISIGIGGHINAGDEGTDVIFTGAKRELSEEVEGFSPRAYLVFEGFLYDPSDGVGQDHIGFVFLFCLPDEHISIREKDTLRGSLYTKYSLLEKKDKMENWSQIVLDHVLK